MALLAGAATAQPRLSGPLVEIRVEGTVIYAEIIRTVITPRPGSPVDRIDLEAERNRLYTLGTFEEVTVSLEEGPAGPIMVVVVKENPRVGEVSFEGATVLAPALLADLLRRENLIEVGAIYNTSRSESAIATIQRRYREAGFPFEVAVVLSIDALPEAAQEGQDPPVRLSYTISEDQPLDSLAFEGSTVLDEAELDTIFGPITQQGAFEIRNYQVVVQRVAERYRELGYRSSGVDLGRTELTAGTLTVRFRELRIAAIDTTAIGVNASALTLKEGDLFNFDTLLDDVRRLAQGRSNDIRLVPLILSGDQVRVTFQLGAPETAGPIDAVVIEGNTVIPTDELLALFRLGEGETFTSTLAQEDFGAIRERYFAEGYLISNRPEFNYRAGTYIQRITELKIAGYEISYDGEPDSTEPFVVLRYLPEVGSVANVNRIDAGLRDVAATGATQPVDRRFLPTEAPDEVLVNIILSKLTTGLFQPALTYATDSGLLASLSFSEKNLLGRAHDISVEANLQTSDVGLQIGGSVRYSVPWLYLNAFDLQEVPTSVSGSVFSVVSTNQVLSSGGNTRVLHPNRPDIDSNQVLVGEFTVRDTGASLSFGRPVADNTVLQIGARGSFSAYALEPPSERCTFDEDNNVINGETCSLPQRFASDFLPQSGLSSFISAGVSFDDRDNVNFPASGVAANGTFGVGLGTDFRDRTTDVQRFYLFEQLEAGASTYVRLSEIAPAEVTDPNHVFAVRLNVGHQFGGEYPSSRRFRVGNTALVAKQIRGYRLSDFNLSRTYAIGSVEYRYDLGLSTFATQTIIAILFADLAYVSSVPGYPEYGAPLFGSLGLGFQLNLGFGGVSLPALRFDYGFSERNPGGVFSFRIGPVF